jgi:hypothetical protein
MLVKIKQKSRSRRWYGNAGARSNAGKSKQNPDHEDGIATLELGVMLVKVNKIQITKMV